MNGEVFASRHERLGKADVSRLAQWILVCAVLCYYIFFPSISVLYKVAVVPYLVEVVDPGRDSWDIWTTEPKIPPTLHGLTPEESHIPPQEWETTYNSCQGVHWRYGDGKDYTFKLYNDKDMRKFMKTYYPWFLETYDAYPHHIQRVDAARYFIMRRFGGIYLDLDVGCKRSLDNLRRLSEVNLVLPSTSPIGISNDFFMAAPEHPFLVFVTERLQSRANSCQWSSYLSVMFSTGPAFFSLALYDYLQSADASQIRKVGLLSHQDYTRNVLWHVYGSSWIEGDGKVIMLLYSHLGTGFLLAGFCLCFLFARKKQREMQSKMKNVDSFKDWAGIIVVASRDELRSVPSRVRARASQARSVLTDRYRQGRDTLSHAIAKVGYLKKKDNSDEDEEQGNDEEEDAARERRVRHKKKKKRRRRQEDFMDKV